MRKKICADASRLPVESGWMCSIACDLCRKWNRLLYGFPSDSGHDTSSFLYWFFSVFLDFVIFFVIKMSIRSRKSGKKAP